ncbi:MAG: hypothetical protein ACRD43_01425 [Pyrinomonadaceae bacterium]
MKTKHLNGLFVIGLCLLCSAAAFGQSSTFSDPNVDYTFELPDARWKMTVKPSATSPNVEYVFGDRNDGHLEVRRTSVAKDALLTDIIRDEEQKLQFRPGYVAGKEEVFAGFLKGKAFNFEYVGGGRNLSGRFYVLRANDTTVYLLRFTGQRDALRTLRNQTDSIARTFTIKK